MKCYIIFFSLLCIACNASAQVLIDSVVAVVNTEAITRSELENEFRIAAIIGKPVVEAPTAAEKRAVLEAIINRKFVLQESERIGIVIAERNDQVAGKIADIHTKYASKIDFQSILLQYQLEIETLEMWAYEQLIYDEFFRRRFFNAVNSAEIERLAKSYYNTNKDKFVVPATVTFNSLLIAVPEDISETEKQKVADLVEKLSDRLQRGETFEAVRETYEKQLSLTLKTLTVETDTPLGKIVTELRTSERSKPLLVTEGYQIVERIRNNSARRKEYPEVSEEITERIQQEQAKQEFEAWLNQQKEEGTWHILDDALTRTENETR